MAYPLLLKNKATELRKKGYSLKEIALKLGIAKSTTSAWVSSISLSQPAQRRLAQRKILGQYKAVITNRQNREKRAKELQIKSSKMLHSIALTKPIAKLCCALIWWCEGNKDTTMVRFTSSDTTLIRNFLYLLRLSFDIDKAKLRCLVHIHNYHNDDIQKTFWSKITKIPLNQFYKSFQKSNTGIRKQLNYPGCVAITYYDAKIAKELKAIYNAWSTQTGVG